MELYGALSNRLKGNRAIPQTQNGASPTQMRAAGPSSNVADDSLASTRAVVLAGGRGTRLAPYTSVLPKPLMPIGDRAILEILLGQLGEQGFRDIVLCVGHLSHLIRAVFDHGGPQATNGSRPQRIAYHYEQQP